MELEVSYIHNLGTSYMTIKQHGLWFYKSYHVTVRFESENGTTEDECSFREFDMAYEWGWNWICRENMNG